MRKRSSNRFVATGIGLLIVGVFSGGASAQFSSSKPQTHGAVTYWHPDSNRQRPSDVGMNVHTNVVGVLLPVANVTPPKASGRRSNWPPSPMSSALPPGYYETPSSLACVYHLVTPTSGCNPTNTALPVITGVINAPAIAVVDAYHNPDIVSDLTTFASQFGLPTPKNFSVVPASGGRIRNDRTGWSLESSLDVEWAYAMSPNAKAIYLVEAASELHERSADSCR